MSDHVFELVTAKPIINRTGQQPGDSPERLDNLFGAYRLTAVDAVVFYGQGNEDALEDWDYENTGDCIPKGESRLLWFHRENSLSYFIVADVNTVHGVRLAKLRLVSDEEIAEERSRRR
jgi:hypothetical protein